MSRLAFLFGIAAPALAAPEFLPAETCALCHSRPGVLTRARSGHELWRHSVMSFAARDPYWLGRVRYEIRRSGPVADIEDKCLRCHAAADHVGYRQAGTKMRLDDLTETGREGVTCTVCHRIGANGLGLKGSFTGGFVIVPEALLFGPHERPFAMPMLHHTGFEPVASTHIRDAALCGTCHTLVTGNSFAEQATYLEWLASAAARRGVTCQSCHVPALRSDDGSVAREYIAQRPPGGPFPPTRPRSPVGIHTFIGGNAQLLEILADADADASDRDGLLDRAHATRRFLRSALRLEGKADVVPQQVTVDITIRNLTGHKLPTGLPGRRLWLHVTARDADGQVVFESGAWDRATGELHTSGRAPVHRNEIRAPGEVIVYEAVMENARGELTNLLTEATRFRKDNRLLPAGFEERSRLPAGLPRDMIRPAGIGADPNFGAGSDTVRYIVPVRAAKLPFRISVEACFQSIRPGDVAGLIGVDSFVRVWGRHSGPVIIGELELVTADEAMRGAHNAHLARGK